jgi:hypothetical protein
MANAPRQISAEAPERRTSAAPKETSAMNAHSKTTDFAADACIAEPNSWAAIAAEYRAAKAETDKYDGEDDVRPDEVTSRWRAADDALIAAIAPDLDGVALKAGMLAMRLEGIDVDVASEVEEALALPDNDVGRLIVEFHRQLLELSTEPLSDLETTDWLFLCLRSEGIAKKCARDEWAGYSLNPHGLKNLVRIVTSIQEDIRELADEHKPGAMSVAVDAIYFGRYPGSDVANNAPPPSPSPCPVAALIPSLDAIVLAEGAADEAGDEPGLRRQAQAREVLEQQAVGLQATSLAGAQLQVLLGLEKMEMVRGNTDQATRDDHHTAGELLLKSALRVFGSDLSDNLWHAYVGGDRHVSPAGTKAPEEQSGTLIGRDAIRDAWQGARSEHLHAAE